MQSVSLSFAALAGVAEEPEAESSPLIKLLMQASLLH